MSDEYQHLMDYANESYPNPVANALFESGYTLKDIADKLEISKPEAVRKLSKQSAWNAKDKRVISQMLNIKVSTIIEWLAA